ncbi:restriction endonuclease subunit S [Acinetobacter indicus]|nr:restriction endonuclease subunit S [Acinetobacter indicus]
MTDVKQLITEHLDIWLTAETEKKSGRGRSSGANDTIYGVQKLRGLIFDCAIRGLLTTHNDNDSAEKIILEISKIKESKKKSKQTDYPCPFTNLPSNWSLTNLSTLTYINPRNNVDNEDIDASFVPMTLIPQVYSSVHQTEIRKWKDIKKGFTHFSTNDIGVAKITPCFENSKACVFQNLDNNIGAGTTELHIVRPIKFLDPRYVLIYFKSPTFLMTGEQYMTGTAGQKRLPKEFVEYFSFPLPPLEEQQRIVEKVDELMKLCDQLEQQQSLSSDAHATLVDTLLKALTESSDADEFQGNWQRIVANFDLLFTTEYSIEQLKQTVLQLAVMGKLVKQDPSDEPASELLKKIAYEKAKLIKEGKIKKSKPLPEITEDEKPFELPSGWEWVRLDALTSKIGAGSTPKGGKEVYKEQGIPFLRSQNVWNEGLELSDVAFIEEATHEKMSGTKVQANDLLFNITGGSIGRCAHVSSDFDTANVSQHVTIVRCVEESLVPYLHLVLRSSYIQDLVMSVQVGVSREGLSISKLSQFVIPLPPLDEQQKIITKAKEIRQIIQELNSYLSKLQKTKLHLADALVANAVEGV